MFSMFKNFFLRPKFRSSSSVILIALAVADTLVLWIGLPDHFLDVLGIYIRSYPVLCQLYNFVNSSSVCIANWLIIVFTLFRLISVYMPHKANIYCSKKRAYLAIFFTIVTPCFYFSYWLYTVEYQVTEDDCIGHKDYITFHRDYQLWLVLTLNSLLPFTILIISNCLIIYKLRKASALRQSMNSTATSEESNSMTAMLLSISILFLVTQTPHFITTIIESEFDYDNQGEEFIAYYYIIEMVTKLLTYVNNVANFFCYCISGRQFRTELALVLRVKCCKRKEIPKEDRSLDTVCSTVENTTGTTL